MRKLFFFIVAFLVIQSCDLIQMVSQPGLGELRISFGDNQDALTRSGLNIPDTSDFILTVSDSKGSAVYEGAYGDSPEAISLPAGNYTVRIVSEEFLKPAFSRPQFGDEQCVVIERDGVVNLKLICTQLNSGIRLKIDPGFLDNYPDGVLLLKSSFGRLVYGYSEKRIAYFKPGNISLVLSNQGKDEVLVTKELKAQDILDLKVLVAAGGQTTDEISSTGRVTVAVDTSRNWLNGSYTIGEGSNGGLDFYDAMAVSDALKAVGSRDVWVSGYIVGGDLTPSSASFEKPFSSRTNVLLGARSSAKDKSACLSVQLPAGDLRDALNLVDNPDMLGRKICIRGDIVEAYYGIPGLKNITEYEAL